jgi:sugar/nucleoside kinase (ribokinase family)
VTAVTPIGNVNVDLIVRPISSLPPPGSEHMVETIEIRAGGAAAIAGLTLARLGASPRIVGCVGDDRFGRFLVDELVGAGLGVADVKVIEGIGSGVSIAFEAPDRDRSFVTSLGSLALFDGALVPDDALGVSLVFVGGYFLAPRLRGDPTARILRAAQERGATTLLDTGWDPQGWPVETRAEIDMLLPAVDVFLPNADEAIALTGLADPRTAAEAIVARSGRQVVVKLGPEGCIAVDGAGSVHEIPAPRVEASDATGAGDAFDAGLIAAMLERIVPRRPVLRRQGGRQRGRTSLLVPVSAPGRAGRLRPASHPPRPSCRDPLVPADTRGGSTVDVGLIRRLLLEVGQAFVARRQEMRGDPLSDLLISMLREPDTGEALGWTPDLRGGLPVGRDVDLHHPIER